MLRTRGVVALAATMVLVLVPLAACSIDEDAKPAEPEDQAALIPAVNEALEVDAGRDRHRGGGHLRA